MLSSIYLTQNEDPGYNFFLKNKVLLQQQVSFTAILYYTKFYT